MSLPVNQVLTGDCIEVMKTFPSDSIDIAMFSPPYWGLRDYSVKGQIGLEPTYSEYVAKIVEVSQQIKRVLKKQGSMYIVLGDTYAGSHCGRGDKTLFQNYRRLKVASNLYNKVSPQANAKLPAKCLIGVPWRIALALIDHGFLLRNDIIWHKPNAMPSSVKDRLTQTYEHIFFFVKQKKYYYDLDAIRKPHKTKSIKRYQHALKEKPEKATHKGYSPKLGAGSQLRRERAVLGAPKYTKHDLAVRRFPTVNRKGGLGYTDPLHVKPYNPKGKNPGDVIRASPETRTLGAITGEKGAVKVPGGKGWVGHPLGGMARIVREQDPRWLPPKGKNPRDFWSIRTKPFTSAHFAVYPEEICIQPIKASCPLGGVVLDPMCGSGTTLVVAKKLGRRYVGIDLNLEYVELAKARLSRIPDKLTNFL